MTELTPYLNFPGNSAEAMRFYHGIFGGKLDVVTFGDFQIPDMPADGTMHAALITDQFRLYASDAMPGAEKTWGGTRVYLALMGDDDATMRRWWEALAADGSVGMPLEPQVWGDTYGILTDKYGIEWMFLISTPAAGA